MADHRTGSLIRSPARYSFVLRSPRRQFRRLFHPPLPRSVGLSVYLSTLVPLPPSPLHDFSTYLTPSYSGAHHYRLSFSQSSINSSASQSAREAGAKKKYLARFPRVNEDRGIAMRLTRKISCCRSEPGAKIPRERRNIRGETPRYFFFAAPS